MEKPILCPFSNICTESENQYQRCVSCIYSKRMNYYMEAFMPPKRVKGLFKKLEQRTQNLEESVTFLLIPSKLNESEIEEISAEIEKEPEKEE